MSTTVRESRRIRVPEWYFVVGLAAFIAACAGPGARQGSVSSPAREAASVPIAPELFAPGTISDAREQWRITFSRDGSTAYFAASEQFFPFSRKATIYVSRFNGSGWSAPDTAMFSGKYSDMDPALSPDGRRLYFSSIRPVNGVVRGDLDIWMVEQNGRGWSDPIHLGPEVNSIGDELYPSVARDGALYFASGPRAPAPGQHYDIYRAMPSSTPPSARNGVMPPRPWFTEGEPLDSTVNRAPRPGDPNLQSAWDFNPEISADGTMLVFTSLRPGGHGLGDLYVSHLAKGKWTTAVNLGPAVNTAADEYHPTLSRDGEWLYFVRRGPNPGDFYRVPARMLPDLIRSKAGSSRDAELR
jgi:hypothetical protein